MPIKMVITMLNSIFTMLLVGVSTIIAIGVLFLFFLFISECMVRFCGHSDKSDYSFVLGQEHYGTSNMLYFKNVPVPNTIDSKHYWLAVWSGAKYIIPMITNILIIIMGIGFIVTTIIYSL